eukprot:scaffold91191_cov34-Phaeocystis_antarctica.AAC.4
MEPPLFGSGLIFSRFDDGLDLCILTQGSRLKSAVPVGCSALYFTGAVRAEHAYSGTSCGALRLE